MGMRSDEDEASKGKEEEDVSNTPSRLHLMEGIAGRAT
jgi:hypothetical protein